MNAKGNAIAVVTGAGSGIGRAVAVELLRAGWSVALAGRRAETLEETAALARAATPASGGVTPEASGVSPEAGGVTPEARGVSPEAGGVTPEARGVSPEAGGVTPEAGGVSPEARGVSPEAGGVTPEARGVSPEAGGVTPEAGGVSPEASGVSPEAGGVTPALRAASLAVRTDVSRPEDVNALFAATVERFGRVDLLFNNAGTFGPGGVPVEELPYEAWRHVVDTNLNGAFLCAQAAYRQMKEQNPQGGRIINNGSISAHTPRPLSVAYTATKHALTGLTKSLSLDGRPYGIAVGQIDIGNAATDMTSRMQTGALQANGEVTPEPVMDVADVARTVRHMAELPLEANVQFATVLATAMPYVGRG